MENWILIAVLAGLASNAFHFFSRILLKDGEDSTAYSWFIETLRVVIFTILAFFDFQATFTPYALILLIAIGFCEILSIYSFAKMHSHSQLSISSIISRTRLIWVPIIALIFLNEHLTMVQYIGILILFLGLSIAQAPHKIFIDKGVKYAYIFALITAVIAVLTKLLTPLFSLPVIIASMGIFPAIFIPLMMKNAKQRIIKSLHTKLLLKVITNLINIASVYLIFLAYKIGPVSQATGIYQSMMIVSVLGGIFLLNEKEDTFKKIIGSIVTLIGVLLLQ